MFKDYRHAISGALLSVLLAAPPSLWGWGNTGHEAVAYVAWQQLTEATKMRVIDLLKRVPTLQTGSAKIPGYPEWVAQLPPGISTDQRNEFLFMRAATWADSIKHHGLHDSDTPPAGLSEEVHIGFTDKQSHGYWHFIDRPFASDSEHLPETPVPNVATQIATLRADIASDEADILKAYDMIWLEHLVGDIHQPLHATVRYVGNSGDRGGNLVKIKLPVAMQQKFKCPPSKSTPRELHAFWDDLPGSCPADTALPVAVTFAKDLPLLLNNPALDQAGRVVDVEPTDWAIDSMKVAQKDAYFAPIGEGLQPKDGSSGFLMTEAYYDHAMDDAKDRIALAGARLAKLLNDDLK